MNSEDTTVIARTAARLTVPIILVTSIALLLQGHNLPGGGFIAGVLTSTAFALVYIIFGMEYLEETVRDRSAVTIDQFPPIVAEYRATFTLGLALAAGSGIVAVALGLPFLEQGFVILHHVPLYGELELASALAFDVGVYLVVVGSLLAILGVVGAE